MREAESRNEYTARNEARKYYDAVPSTNDPSVQGIDGIWELRTVTGPTLELMLIRGRGILTEHASGGEVITEQDVIANRVNEQILVLGLNAKRSNRDKEKAHPSMLLFSPQGNSFQVLWRYADSNAGWSPVEVKSHNPL
jgi:hypothetical protein